MSGHSKWSSIKHQKAIKDARRGKVFSKFALQITVAARRGADLSANPTLRMVVENAKKAGMPKANIHRAIERGSGRDKSDDLAEIIYEAYAPAGVGLIIRAVTDNKNRTLSQIKALLNKFDGKLAGKGAVSFQFKETGLIILQATKGNDESILLQAIEAGADDVNQIDGKIYIYTHPNKLHFIQERLEKLNYDIEKSEISFKPINLVTVADQAVSGKIAQLIEELENLDEVTQVCTNFDQK